MGSVAKTRLRTRSPANRKDITHCDDIEYHRKTAKPAMERRGANNEIRKLIGQTLNQSNPIKWRMSLLAERRSLAVLR